LGLNNYIIPDDSGKAKIQKEKSVRTHDARVQGPPEKPKSEEDSSRQPAITQIIPAVCPSYGSNALARHFCFLPKLRTKCVIMCGR
jgi:hypothetical protein